MRRDSILRTRTSESVVRACEGGRSNHNGNLFMELRSTFLGAKSWHFADNQEVLIIFKTFTAVAIRLFTLRKINSQWICFRIGQPFGMEKLNENPLSLQTRQPLTKSGPKKAFVHVSDDNKWCIHVPWIMTMHARNPLANPGKFAKQKLSLTAVSVKGEKSL